MYASGGSINGENTSKIQCQMYIMLIHFNFQSFYITYWLYQWINMFIPWKTKSVYFLNDLVVSETLRVVYKKDYFPLFSYCQVDSG